MCTHGLVSPGGLSEFLKCSQHKLVRALAIIIPKNKKDTNTRFLYLDFTRVDLELVFQLPVYEVLLLQILEKLVH